MTPDPVARLIPPLRRSWRYPAALVIVAVSTAVSELLYRAFDTNRLSMVFLAGVLITAVSLGSGPAYFAAALAFLIYNIYLVEPRFTFELASPEDVLVLIVFAAVAMLTGRLAGRVRDEGQRAESRARTAAALFEASRDLSSIEDEAAIRERLAGHIAQAAKGQAVVWDLRDQAFAAPADAPVQDLLDLAADWPQLLAGSTETIQAGPWRVRALRGPDDQFGLAAWRAPAGSDSAVEDQLITVLVDLGAAAITRARLSGVRAEMQAAARTEQLRNALLSSISHDLRTPLAAILASASGLREFGDRFSAAVQSDLVLTIEEEADRLNRFVANLLNMTKLESGALNLELASVDIAEVLERVLRRVAPRLGARQVQRHFTPGLTVLGDALLLEQAITNVVENALRFSPDGSVIALCVSEHGGMTRIAISDEGPGVPLHERALIFEKFYRSSTTGNERQGTGLGLSITQGLVSAMHGQVAAGGRSDGRDGLVVTISLPRTAA